MISTIQEGDYVEIRLIHTLGDTSGFVTEASVVRSDVVGVVVGITVNKRANHVFIPWSNIMAMHVIRDGVESGNDSWGALDQVVGDHPENEFDDNDKIDVISKEEKRHRELVEAQRSVTFFNGDL